MKSVLKSTDNSYEPRYVESNWTTNRGYIHLEAISKSPEFNPSACIITGQPGNSKFSAHGVRKLAVSKFSCSDMIPLINSKNRTVTFTVNGVQYQCDLDVGFYSVPGYSPKSLLYELLAQMSLASGFVFTVIPNVLKSFDSVYGGGLFYEIAIQGGVDTFRFVKTPTMEKLVPVFGPPFSSFEQNSFVVGPLLLLPTRHIDVRSNALTADQKIQSFSNSYGASSTIFRVNLRNIYDDQAMLTLNPQIGIYSGSYLTYEEENLRWINMDPNKAISSIDITLIDEFGEILETLPPQSDQSGYPFSYSMELLIEPNI